VFYGLKSANTNDDFDKIAEELAPILSQHGDEISLNENLVSMNKILEFMYLQMPEFADILAKSKVSLQTAQKTLEALNNNPFLRGGIKEEAPTQQKNTKIRLMDLDQ